MRLTDSVIISMRFIINLWHTGCKFISRSNETFVQLHECKENEVKEANSAKETTVNMRFRIVTYECKAKFNKFLKEFANTVKRPLSVTSAAFYVMLVSSIYHEENFDFLVYKHYAYCPKAANACNSTCYHHVTILLH